MPEIFSAIPGINVPSGALFAPGGPSGPGGAQGDTGETGPTGPYPFTNLIGDFDLPEIGESLEVEVEDASWMILGQMLYVDMGGGEAEILQLTARTGNTITLLNPLAVGPAIEGPRGPTGDTGPIGLPPISNFQLLSGATNLSPELSGTYLVCAGGEWTLGLPAPQPSLTYFVRNDMGLTAPSGPITLSPASGTIDGKAQLLLLPGQECRLFTDGTNWRTFGLQREVIIGTIDISALGTSASSPIQLPRGFRSFEIDWDEVLINGNAWLFAQGSVDGGATWVTTYNRGYILNNSATTLAVNYIAGQPSLYTVITVDPAWPAYGKSLIFPGRTGVQGHMQTLCATWAPTFGNYQVLNAGYFNAGGVNAIRLYSNLSVTTIRATLKGRA